MTTPEQKKQFAAILNPHAKKILDGVLDDIERALLATRDQVPDHAALLSLLAEVSAVTLGMAQMIAGPNNVDKITSAVLDRAGVQSAFEQVLASMPKITNPGNGTVN